MKKLIVLATALTFALAVGCGGTSTNSTKVTSKTPDGGTTTAETKVK